MGGVTHKEARRTNSMDTYSQLLTQIYKNNVLAKVASDMVRENAHALNLLSTDWEKRLDNNIVYQDLSYNNKSMFRDASPKNQQYTFEYLKPDWNLLVAGVCRFYKSYAGQDKMAIVVLESVPLGKIGKAVWENGDVQDEVKFQFNLCSSLCCSLCKNACQKFERAGYEMKKVQQPCIYDTKLFDGKEVLNRFVTQMEGVFPHTFLALLKVKVDNRYGYTDAESVQNHRIGGRVLEMVAFHETKLVPMKEIDVGDLKCIDLNEKRPVEEEEIVEAYPKRIKKPREEDVLVEDYLENII